MLAVRTILHPTDLSEASTPAFRLACALARDYAVRLVLLAVYKPPLTGSEAADRKRPNGIADDLLVKRQELKPDDRSVEVECLAEEGWPAEAIGGAAACVRADLIVMGTHGRTGLRRVPMGSIAEAVCRKVA